MKSLLELHQVKKLIYASNRKRKSKEIRHQFGAYLDAIEIVKSSDTLTPEINVI